MGLIFGSANFTRFRAAGSLPDGDPEDLHRRILRYAFRDMEEDSDQERVMGWVDILDPLESRFAAREYLKEPCLALSWRVDERKVPPQALKRFCREAEERIKAEEGLEYLARPRRRDIKEAVRLKLLRRVIPSTRVYDVIWDLRSGAVLFGAVSARLCDEFAEFFLGCFGIHLEPVFPFATARNVLEKAGRDPSLLEGLSPAGITEV